MLIWRVALAANTVGFFYHGFLLMAGLAPLRGMSFFFVLMCAGAVTLVCNQMKGT